MVEFRFPWEAIVSVWDDDLKDRKRFPSIVPNSVAEIIRIVTGMYFQKAHINVVKDIWIAVPFRDHCSSLYVFGNNVC